MFLKRLLHYLNPLTMFKKSDPVNGENINVKLMHGINRISIFMFLVGAVIVIIRVIRAQ